MMEDPISIVDKFILYILELLDTPVMYLKPIDVILMAGVIIGIYFFFKVLFKAFMKYGFQGLKIVYQPFVIVYVKNKDKQKNKRICHVCKNPLHNCTCPNNRGVPYRQRLANWKAREKSIKLANKRNEYVQKERSKPVVLKKKKKRKGGS